MQGMFQTGDDSIFDVGRTSDGRRIGAVRARNASSASWRLATRTDDRQLRAGEKIVGYTLAYGGFLLPGNIF